MGILNVECGLVYTNLHICFLKNLDTKHVLKRRESRTRSFSSTSLFSRATWFLPVNFFCFFFFYLFKFFIDCTFRFPSFHFLPPLLSEREHLLIRVDFFKRDVSVPDTKLNRKKKTEIVLPTFFLDQFSNDFDLPAHWCIAWKRIPLDQVTSE